MAELTFDQRFEKDKNLDKVTLPNVYFLYEEDDTFYPARLELFGRSAETNTYKDGELYTRTRSSVKDGVELHYRIVEKSEEMLTLKLHNDSYYKMSISDFEHYREYVKEINLPFVKLEDDFAYRVQSKLSIALQDSELVQMTLNFIEDAPSDIFLNPSYITRFECFLEFEASVGKSLLLSDEIQRAVVSHLTEETVEISDDEYGVTTNLSIDNFQDISPYIQENFILFASLVANKINIEESNEALYLTYIFLNEMVIRLFSQKWEDKAELFEITSNDIQELVQQYSIAETINPKDIKTMGTFVCFLISQRGSDNYLTSFQMFSEVLDEVLKQNSSNDFRRKLQRVSSPNRYSIDDVDIMGGLEFEEFLGVLFSNMGYETKVTKATGDQGIDLIASKTRYKIGVQAKRYSGSVGNSAIQEAYAGKKYYQLDKIIVVTNSFFTDSAIQLAEANDVILWDRSILKEKISELF